MHRRAQRPRRAVIVAPPLGLRRAEVVTPYEHTFDVLDVPIKFAQIYLVRRFFVAPPPPAREAVARRRLMRNICALFYLSLLTLGARNEHYYNP